MAADHNLNGFRDHGRPGRNLADMHLATHGLGPEARHAPWLVVNRPAVEAAVVFALGPMPQRRFPLEARQGHLRPRGMLRRDRRGIRGFPLDRRAGPSIPTANLLEVARVIAGSRLFVGNQSCPAAIAEGLKHPMILEVFPTMANCCFERLGRINAWGDDIELPALSC